MIAAEVGAFIANDFKCAARGLLHADRRTIAHVVQGIRVDMERDFTVLRRLKTDVALRRIRTLGKFAENGVVAFEVIGTGFVSMPAIRHRPHLKVFYLSC